MITTRSTTTAVVAALLTLVACEEKVDEASAEAAPAADAGKPGFDHGEYALKVKFLREQLAAKKKCDKKTALELSKYLNKAKDYDGNVAFVEAFAKECGDWPRHLWSAAHAREKQKRWDDAALLDTRLIEHDMTDSDFWWWRGRARAESGQTDKADADFRQSMANKPTGWPAFRHAKYLGDKDPCGSAFLIQWWMEHGRKIEDWAAPKRDEHYVKGACKKLEGKGRTSVKKKKNAPVVEVTAKVNGKKGKFLLADRSAFVTVSKAFADKAGVAATAEVDPVLVFGELLPAKVGAAKTVAMGKARAPDVKVAVTDEVPGDVDGVIGQSFLQRFLVEQKPKAILIKAR